MLFLFYRSDLLALLYVRLNCVFVTLPHSVLDQVEYFIAWIPVCCLIP